MTVSVRTAESEEDYNLAEQLIREYLESIWFVIDFQPLDQEFAGLREEYGPPTGRALLGYVGDEVGGFVGVRAFDGGACEMKRLFVRAQFRGSGLGRALAEASLEAARDLGYERMLLDTVRGMDAANALYESMGFRDIEAYRYNPRPDARYLALEL